MEESSTTSTTEVPRVVGEPLDSWIVVTAGLALLALLLIVGLVVTRRLRAGAQTQK